jgi:hypothetical protein
MLADDELRQALSTRFPDPRPDLDEELERLLDRAGARARTRRASYVIGLVAAAVVALVFVFGPDWSLQTKAPEPVDDPPAGTQVLYQAGDFSNPAPLEPGRYRARFAPAREYLGLQVDLDVPAGWGQDDVYSLAAVVEVEDSERHIDLLGGRRRVQSDPCSDRTLKAGHGALAVARKLALQARADVTGPTAVTLGGYPGYYLRIEDYRETKTCTAGVDLWRNGEAAGLIAPFDRPDWINLIWVVDIGVEDPVIISASYGPDVTPAQVDELIAIVESASFVLP